jgi:glycine/D-amino acid oxidase-like deaminating enzyme
LSAGLGRAAALLALASAAVHVLQVSGSSLGSLLMAAMALACLPLLGASPSPRVFVAGGHGMWGIALGPLTGQLMAQTVLKGEAPPELAPFDPLR